MTFRHLKEGHFRQREEQVNLPRGKRVPGALLRQREGEELARGDLREGQGAVSCGTLNETLMP